MIENLAGKFITFEGVDGVGKTTQLALVSKTLNRLGYKTVATREPGGTDFAEGIRAFLKQYKLDSLTELFLIAAARRNHFINKIKPAIEQGAIVLCDRFYDSTIIYQGVLGKIPIDKILELQAFILDGFEPNLTILLDIDYKTARYRSQARNAELFLQDRYDSLSEDNYKLINESYRRLAKIFSNRIVTIKASLSRETLSEKIVEAILKIL